MKHSQHSGFRIGDGKIPITISMRPLDGLKPHEEVVESELDAITQSILTDKVLRHPLIADSDTSIVLDGTHRLKALQRLSLNLAPVALVDYQDPEIQIDRWYRTIAQCVLDEIVKDLTGFDVTKEDPVLANYLLDERKAFAVLSNDSHSIVFHQRQSSQNAEGLLQLMRQGFRVETFLREKPRQIAYADNIPKPIPPNTLVLSTIKLEKEDVIALATKDHLFPPKSSRHVIPSRPLGTRVPLSMLSIKNLDTAQARLIEHLSKMKVTRVEKGSVIGSRKYEEEVLLFV